MKNRCICILVTLIAFCIVYIRMSEEVINYNNYFSIDNTVKYVDSDIIEEIVQEVSVVDEVKQESSNVSVEKEVLKETNKVIVNTPVEVVEEVVNVPANEILTGKMSGYGPDCIGCSGYLANGTYVGGGNIYYDDSEYGRVRIVAGDKKFKFGTIVRINDSMLAIVLDRGGSIGIGKKFMFDLLYESEAEANRNGVSYNTKFEILRNGF
ncbi:MAG: hypothetical protein IJE53_04080 [Bacilli bacterium]|nr:hypothetical protein [Bacilli bacterium]